MSSFSPTEVTQGTTGAFASDFSEFACNHEDQVYLDGETFAFPNIPQRDDLKFIEAKVISSPEDEDDDNDEDDDGDGGDDDGEDDEGCDDYDEDGGDDDEDGEDDDDDDDEDGGDDDDEDDGGDDDEDGGDDDDEDSGNDDEDGGDDDEGDEDDDGDGGDDDRFDLTLRMTIEVDSTVHSIDDADISKEFKKIVNKWIIQNDPEYSRYMKITAFEVDPRGTSDSSKGKSSNGNFKIISITVRCDGYVCEGWLGNIVKSPFFDEVWNKHMYSLIKEGVCYAEYKVPDHLRDSLRVDIDDVAKNTVVDYHPNSNDIVRDLVHPALYSYIKGVSPTVTQFTPVSGKEKSDFWQRPYEDSVYQWLPTPFKVSENGKCSILEYINNLDREKFPCLYKDLENLFEIFLPYFEEVWSYAKALELYSGETDDDADWQENVVVRPLKKEPVSFKGRELQVIPKIVEYKLKPGESYEGVWHCEGMSHENIVMTGIYFLDRDSDIDGASLRFKRAFTVEERNFVFRSIPQTRPSLVNEVASEGFVPLGEFPTEEGRLLVFPNCHIHKLAKMANISDTKSARRRIVVFFFVNPEKQIISTREVPPQQKVIKLADAKAHRLKLMAERKYDKMKLNVRDIELCEH